MTQPTQDQAVKEFMESNGFHWQQVSGDVGFWRNIGEAKIPPDTALFFYTICQKAGQGTLQRGREVGQYQAADNIYSYATSAFMLEQKPVLMHEQIAEIVKICESYLNGNRSAYVEYLKAAPPQTTNQTKEEYE